MNTELVRPVQLKRTNLLTSTMKANFYAKKVLVWENKSTELIKKYGKYRKKFQTKVVGLRERK